MLFENKFNDILEFNFLALFNTLSLYKKRRKQSIRELNQMDMYHGYSKAGGQTEYSIRGFSG